MLSFLSLFPLPIVNMEAQKDLDLCKFNILFTKSVPHIQEMIFFSLDLESFKTCLEVSTDWRELLTSESHLKKAKSFFHEEIDHDENKLLDAANKGNVEKVKSLCGSVLVDVNCVKGFLKTTPLIEVVGRSSYTPNCKYMYPVIQLLLERGAKPNIADRDGFTPLYLATIHEIKDIVHLLLKRGANPDPKGRNGWAPLHSAAKHGNEDIVQLLISKGANPNIMTKRGNIPLHFAASNAKKTPPSKRVRS